MKINRIIKIMTGVAMAMLVTVSVCSVKAEAKVYTLTNGTVFDSDFYAALYPDVRASYDNGKNPDRLLYHYLTYGIKEGRIPSGYGAYYPAGVTYYPTPVMQVGNVVYPAGYYCVVPTQYIYPNGISTVFSQCYAIPSTKIAGTVCPAGYCTVAPAVCR